MSKEKFKVFEGVFDESTLDTLQELKRKGYYDELSRPIKTGKEGDVYLAYKGDELRAIKIYRITSANFKKISEYITRDFRFKSIKGNLRKVILAWAQKEFRNLNLCHKESMNVPFAYKQLNNVIIMEYIEGDMLKDTYIENPKAFYKSLIEQLRLLKNDALLIHGDLSEYNILVKNQRPYLIDFGQAMSIKNNDDFERFQDLFERDILNVVNHLNKKYELNLKVEDVIKEIC